MCAFEYRLVLTMNRVYLYDSMFKLLLFLQETRYYYSTSIIICTFQSFHNEISQFKIYFWHYSIMLSIRTTRTDGCIDKIECEHNEWLEKVCRKIIRFLIRLGILLRCIYSQYRQYYIMFFWSGAWNNNEKRLIRLHQVLRKNRHWSLGLILY